MHSDTGAAQQDERIPRVAPGRDPAALPLSPAEGFLLSRIDGTTPWSLLRAIGGIPPEEVDRTLARWVDDGLVVIDGGDEHLEATDQEPTAKAARTGPKPGSADEIDSTLDLSPELQRKIIDFETGLDTRSYFEILSVGRDADAKEIKRAYFKLSKQFHPDRYFRREIGGFASRLDGIFKRVMEAYELLTDPTTRAEIEKGFPSAPPPEEEASPKPAEPQVSSGQGYRKPTRWENLERLRGRFRVPDKLMAERRFRAGQFFEAARLSMQQQRWLEAAASARLAIAFDPWNREYKSGFVEIQAEVNRVRAVELLEQAADADARTEALRLLEEAIHFRPCDPEANARAGALALSMGDLERAREYSDAAAEIEPEVAGYHVLRSRVLRREGDLKAAREAIGRAFKLAPNDSEVRAERKLVHRADGA